MQMKKVITTITALTFALGLASASLAQMEKPAAKPETPAASTQVAPKAGEKATAVEATKPGEAAKPVTKEEPKAGEKAKSVKAEGNGKTKKNNKKGKDEKKPATSVTPVEKPKEEPKK